MTNAERLKGKIVVSEGFALPGKLQEFERKGAIGLIAFAVVIWRMLEGRSAVFVIAGATLAWAVTAVGAWATRRALVHRVCWRKRKSEATADRSVLGGH